MMKRYLWLMLCLLVAGCGKKDADPVAAPAPVPIYQPGDPVVIVQPIYEDCQGTVVEVKPKPHKKPSYIVDIRCVDGSGKDELDEDALKTPLDRGGQ